MNEKKFHIGIEFTIKAKDRDDATRKVFDLLPKNRRKIWYVLTSISEGSDTGTDFSAETNGSRVKK